MQQAGPIGVFDSGYGGLTVYKELVKALPQYDFVYLGDNARVPYGTRSFETVYQYTWQCVQQLFKLNCHLVILACNTASAKALRSIQQNDLPKFKEHKRVLGVLRPSTEKAGEMTKSGHLGIFATEGTVRSKSYEIEIAKFFPEVEVSQQACPMWVPLVENDEYDKLGADYFVKQYIEALLAQDADIDMVLLACTHYPLLEPKIKEFLPEHIQVVSQGELVANSLKDYLNRHQEMDSLITKSGKRQFFTTESPEKFSDKAELFLGEEIEVEKVYV
ncbi:MAG: glutamate racemase [Bacteroidia bacterium]